MEHNGTGPEGLAQHLNSYFSVMCRLIASDGGDVFKFAGDACIVLWPDVEEMKVRVLRAVQCAYAIQNELHEVRRNQINEIVLTMCPIRAWRSAREDNLSHDTHVGPTFYIDDRRILTKKMVCSYL